MAGRTRRCGRRRSRRRQSRAGDHRRCGKARHAWRSRRRASPRVWRVSGDVALSALLDVQHLTVSFDAARGTRVVDDVSFTIQPGETLGLVGESGSGKSVTAYSILRLLQPPGEITGGRILFEGQDLLTLTERDMRAVRGARISLIFQEPMTALNPVMRVGDQI